MWYFIDNFSSIKMRNISPPGVPPWVTVQANFVIFWKFEHCRSNFTLWSLNWFVFQKWILSTSHVELPTCMYRRGWWVPDIPQFSNCLPKMLVIDKIKNKRHNFRNLIKQNIQISQFVNTYIEQPIKKLCYAGNLLSWRVQHCFLCWFHFNE